MTGTTITPYLFFGGRCDEALEFYRKALGAEVEMVLRFDQSPEPPPPGMVPSDWDNKVMHASFHVGDSLVQASDGRCTGKAGFQGFSLTLNVADEAEAKRVFAALSDGGNVQMPLAKTFFASCFGTLTDRFGVLAIARASVARHLRYLRQMGLAARLAGERPLDISVAESARERALEKMLAVGKQLRDADGANVIVMGCAGMARHRAPLESALGIPVIDPTQAAVAMAIGAVQFVRA